MSYFSSQNLGRRIFPSLSVIVELARALKSKASLTTSNCMTCPFLSIYERRSLEDAGAILDTLLPQSEHCMKGMLRAFVLVLIIALTLGFLTGLLISRL